MILAAALVVAVARPMPPAHGELLQRWQAANRAGVPASRRLNETELASPPPVQRLRVLADNELSSSAYHLTASSSPERETLWERFWDWVGEQWNRLWDWLTGHASVNKGGAAVLGTVLTVLAAGVILIVTFRLLSELHLERLRRSRSRPLAGPIDARAFYDRACERAQAGDYAAAARLLFAATIALLDLRGAVRDDRSATVGEFRTVLRSRHAALVPAFNEIAGTFVTSAYAEQSIARAQWEAARDAYDALEAPATP